MNKMKTYIDVLKVICSGDFNKPLYIPPKTMHDYPRMTTLGIMYNISIIMVIDGKY